MKIHSNLIQFPLIKKILLLLLLLIFNKAESQNYSWDTSLKINREKYHISTRSANDSEVVIMVKKNSKLLQKVTLPKDGLMDFDLLDFNKDGRPDILVTYMNNHPWNMLWLFDKSTDRFREVKGFEDFPEAIQLKTYHHYYYSYHSAGCADGNWVSDLFKIENFRAIQVGHINTQGCEEPFTVKVYKSNPSGKLRKKPIDNIPYKKTWDYENSKWGFLNAYWNNNWRKFL